MSELLEIYTNLEKQPNLQPSPEVNTLFTSLYHLSISGHGHLYFENSVQKIIPSLHTLCALGEGALELYYAKQLQSANNQKTWEEIMISFPYYQGYCHLAKFELETLLRVVNRKIGRAMFVGSGPMPFSVQQMSKTVPFDIMDCDELACELGADFLRKKGFSNKAICVDMFNFKNWSNYDMIFVASLVGSTIDDKGAILEYFEQKLRSGTILALRTATGLRRVLYQEIPKEIIPRSFQFLGVYDPIQGSGNVNSLMILKKI